MTLEQAIEVLTDRYNSSVTRRRTDAEWRLATDTAIAALRQQIGVGDMISLTQEQWYRILALIPKAKRKNLYQFGWGIVEVEK